MIAILSTTPDDPRLGGKGRGLAALARAGALIPPTLCLTPEDTAAVLRLIPDGLYAVRSSAYAEDGHVRSLAGQFISFLRVPTDRVWQAVLDCRAAGADCVLLQPSLAADRAGVLFTCDPVTGSRNHLRIDEVEGTAEELLAGRRPGVSTTATRDAPLRLVQEALAIESQLGGPLDLEWALVGEHLYWLQARPVTGLGGWSESHILQPGELPTGEPLWTSANAREALPDVATPLFQEFCLRFIGAGFGEVARLLGLEQAPGDLVGFFEGRVYLNVTALNRLATSLPLANPEVLSQRLLGLPARQPAVKPSWKLLKPLATAAARTARLGAAFREFEARELATFRHRDLTHFSDAQIETRLEALGDMGEAFSWHGLGTGLYTGLYHALEELVGEPPGGLLLGLGNLRFGGSAAALRRLAGEPAYLDQFLEDYGHQGSGTIDFAVAPWRERPEVVLELAETLRRQGETDPEAYRQGLVKRRQQTLTDLRSRLGPLARLRFEALVPALQAAAPYRENFKFHLHRRLAMMRTALLELGRRRHPRPDDIFYGGEEGRRVWERQRRQGYPLHRVGDKAYFPALPDSRELQGTPGSPGLARGPARVLLSLAEGGRLQPGEVLVVPSTDPSWTPLFSLAAAVVVEVGSALSHGAVVAREIGVPAVLGLPGVVACVQDGEMVEVDGHNGIVRLPVRRTPR